MITMPIRPILAFTLSVILILQIFSVTQFGIADSKNAFAQTPNQPSYALYQNNNEGVSIEYPSDWKYSEKTQGQAMLTYFYPPNDSQTFLELSYDKTTNYHGTDQQILDELPQIISILCSDASIAKNGFTCSDFQYKTSTGKYQGVPAYVLHGRMTESFSDGSSREQDIVQFLIINQNSDYGIFVTCPKDKCSNYDNELTYVVNSLNIYSLKAADNSNVPAQVPSYNIPSWIKNTAKWWSQGSVTDDDFVKGIQYLIQQGIITVPTTQVSSQSSHAIPSWVKNTAKWWSEGQVGDSDFVQGIQYLVRNGIISTQNIDQSQTAVTDQQGMVSFQIKGQNVPFRFVDDTTGLPLSGFDVAFALDPKTQSVGTLLIVDPDKNYPLQVVMLSGSVSNSNIPTSFENHFIPTASAETSESLTVTVFKDPRTIGSLMLVTFLPGVGAEGGDIMNNVYEGLALAAKAADKKGWFPVSDYLEKHGFMTGTTTFEDANKEIQDDSVKGYVRDGIFLAGGSLTGHVASSLVGMTVGTTLNLKTTGMDVATVSGCDPQTQEIKWVQIGFTRIYSCTNNKAYGLLKYNPPNESDHVSLDLLSKANQGFGEKIQADNGQSVPVPADDYTVRISTPGKTPVTEDVTVPPDQTTTIDTELQPLPNNNRGQMTSTITPARDLSGHWSGSFSMKDTTSDGCTFSGTWEATLTQNDNDLSGSFSIVDSSSPDYPANDFCTLAPGTFNFEGGTVSSSSFQFDTSGGEFHVKGYFTSDLIHGNFNECYDESCASGTFTGSRG